MQVPFRTAEWEVWPERGRLLRGDIDRRLTVQQMQLLVFLVRHRHRVVPKSEIFREVWNDAHIDEVALPRCVSELRRALGDEARRPRFIRTYPKRGYRWVAAVEDLPETVAVSAAPEGEPVAAAQGEPLWRRRPLPALALFMLSGAAIMLPALFESASTLGQRTISAGVAAESSPAPRPIVAVLALEDLDPRTENDWLSGALAEMLANELALSDRLSVMPPAAVAGARFELGLGTAETSRRQLEQLRRALGADLLVTGSYLGPDPEVRIDLRVWRLKGSDELEALVESGTQHELVSLVERAGRRLRDQLDAQSGLEGRQLRAKADAFLRHQEAEKAKELLEAAVAMDPDDSLAFAGLAEAWAQLGYESRAEEAAQKAQQTAFELAPASRLWVEAEGLRRRKQWTAAIERLEALRVLAPGSHEYRLRLARVLLEAGRLEEALDELRRAGRDEDPRFRLLEAAALHQRGDYEQAMTEAEKGARLAAALGAPRVQAEALLQRALSAYALALVPQALADLGAAQALAESAGDRRRLATIEGVRGGWHVAAGRFAEARANLGSALAYLRQIGDRKGQSNVLRALADVGLKTNEHEQARRHLDEAIALAGELSSPPARAAARRSRAILEASLGNYEAARRDFEAALEFERALGNLRQVAQSLSNLARLALLEARYGESVRRFEEAREVLAAVGTERLRALWAYNAGLAYAITGDLEAAERHLRQAVDFFHSVGNDLLLGRSLIALGEVQIDRSQPAAAKTSIDRAEQVFAGLGDAARLAAVANAEALLALETGEPGQASELAAGVLDKGGVVFASARVTALRLLVEAALESGEEARAGEAIERAMAELAGDGVAQGSLSRHWLGLSRARWLAATGRWPEARRVASGVLDRSAEQGAWLIHAEAELSLLAFQPAAAADLDAKLDAFAQKAAAKGWRRLAEEANALRRRQRSLG